MATIQSPRSLVWWLLVALTISLIAVLVLTKRSILRTTDSQDSSNTIRPDQKMSPEDPCWFMTLRDTSIPYEVIKERQDRELRGYPTEIPLGEAVRIFNQEKQCDPTLAPYPPLTEDELIAAIVAGPGYGVWGEPWLAQKDTLFKIAKDKVMPKGSLLVATGGPNVQESPLRPYGDIKAKGISIAIFLGLEKHEYGQDLKQEQIFEIRRTYFSVETVR